MIRAVEFRGRSWRVVADNEHACWALDELEKGWERDAFDTIDKYVDGGTFVDVGAWIGLHSMFASSIADHVIALEPDPVAASQLTQNLVLNDVDNVRLVPAALWHEDGVVELAAYGEWGSSMTGPFRTGDRLPFPAITPGALRTMIPGPVELVKVDTEGSELMVLRGLLRWGCPIHLSVHADLINPLDLDFEDRTVTWLAGDPVHYSVLLA